MSSGWLNITNAATSDGGVYQCVVESRLGMAVSQTRLIIAKKQF